MAVPVIAVLGVLLAFFAMNVVFVLVMALRAHRRGGRVRGGARGRDYGRATNRRLGES
jgi:hypothetical protein